MKTAQLHNWHSTLLLVWITKESCSGSSYKTI